MVRLETERERERRRESKQHCPFLLALTLVNTQLYFDLLGILIGSSSAYMTVYAQVLHNSDYDSYDDDVGYVGLATQVFAMAAQLFVGVWISRTKTY